MLVLVLPAKAQNKQPESIMLTGVVKDERNETVPGANIYLKDSPGVGVTTDLDGKFTIKVKKYDVLIISYLGYKDSEYRVEGNKKEVQIILQPSSEELEEVVIVGMGTQRKVSVAGAITAIKPSELEVPATNIVNSLGGRVAGIISVQSSGEPGKNISEFWVRGIGTFGANSSALVLIDGLEGSLDQIDPADVESFSVLKDASATAVYGNRGANGVVLVTTKRGLEQKLRITARANLTVSKLKRLPEYLGGYEYAQLANEASAVSGMPRTYSDMELDIIKYGLDPDLYPNINWQDEILKSTSLQKTYYVSAQGGGSVARYFVSIGMSNEDAAYKSMEDSKYNKGVGYNTYNYRLNLDINLTKTTKVYVGADGFLAVNRRPSMGKPGSENLTDWIWQSQAKTTPLLYPLRYSSGELPSVGEGSDIPPHVLLNYTGSAKDENYTNKATISITQDLSMLTKGLTFDLQGAWNTYSSFNESRYKMPTLYYTNGRTNTGRLKLVKRIDETSMNYANSSSTSSKLVLNSKLNYERKFGDHRIGGLLYYSMESSYGSGSTTSMDAIPKRYQSLSGRFTYSFQDTYSADLNFGYNGSENFEPGKQFGFFPAGAVAWIPTSYKFMQENVKWLNFLKFRFSYGTAGNDRITFRRFPYLTLIKEDGTIINPWGGTGSLTESQVGADNLQWEKAYKTDLGMEAHFFNDKFTFILDYFHDKRDGIFQERRQIPDYVGVISMPFGNVGSMKSWGSDGNFEFFQTLNKDLYFTLRGNFTLSKNKILNWEQAEQKYPYLAENGYSNSVQRGFIALGLFKDQQDVDMSPKQFGTVRPGDIKYKDVNSDGKITDEDKVPLFANSGVPQMMYGFGGEFHYKNWTLNVLFKGTGKNLFLYGGSGGDKFDGYMPFNNGNRGNVLSLAYDQSNRWTPASYSGDPATENPEARFPRLYYGHNDNNTKPSTFWMGNARYLRLQELSLTYSLKVAALRRFLGIQSMDVQLMCENLAVWDSVKLFDPEQATSTGQTYPIPGRYSLQLYLHF